MQRTPEHPEPAAPAITRRGRRRSLRSRLAERLDSTIAVLPVGNAIERADTRRGTSRPCPSAHRHRHPARHPAAEANSGEGTIGKFVADTGLYQRQPRRLRSLKTLIDRLNKHSAS
ncbi:MAG: hypothetical protein IPG75_15390 [Gemmatimonadetes bacterium]|nr:hypothetical protein [Gemmatimonadota bacterium]